MTREEHIENLKAIASDMPSDKCSDWIESLMAGVKALEQEPCENCCNGNQIEKAKLCQKSYLAGMEHKQEPCGDAVSRSAVLDGLASIAKTKAKSDAQKSLMSRVMFFVKELPSVTPMQKWILVSERLPEDLEPVNITWVNHEPEPYYHDIKDKNYVATGIHYKGQWYWYSTTCADYLGEYGSNEVDKVDDAIEIVAWMPLPEPYQPKIPTVAEGSEE